MKNVQRLVSPNPENQLSPYLEQESVQDLLFEFLRDRTPLTEVAYHRDLRDFFAFTETNFGLPQFSGGGMAFDEVKRVHIVQYKKFLEAQVTSRGKPYAPNTINRKLSAISSFYQFLLQREVVEKNPAALCVRPKRIVREETQAFSDREMKNLFDLVIEEASPLQRTVEARNWSQ